MARITDGFPTTVSLLVGNSGDTVESVLFWEKTVTPPGVQGGGPNDTTTMRNTRWRTRQAKKLLTLSEAGMTCAYDPALYSTIMSVVQVNRRWQVDFPDGSAIRIWAWLDEFTPNEVSEGEQPDADVTVIPSNQDNTSTEVGPEFIAAT